MVPFRIFEHTADIGVEATGHTFDEALQELVRGFAAMLLPDGWQRVDQREVWTDTLESPDPVRLVVDLVDRLNYEFQVDGRVAARAEIRARTGEKGWRADLTLHGERYDPQRHGYPMEIKAATLHQTVADPQKSIVRVLVDI